MRRLILIGLLAAGCNTPPVTTDAGPLESDGGFEPTIVCGVLSAAYAQRGDGCAPPCPYTCVPTSSALDWCLARIRDGADNDCETLTLDVADCALETSVGEPVCMGAL